MSKVRGLNRWGFLVTLSLFFYFYSISLARSFQKNPIWFFVSFLGIAVVFIAVLYLMRYLGYVATLELWVPIVLESAFGYGILDLLLAPFRILTGPGPVRSLQEQDIFGTTRFLATFFRLLVPYFGGCVSVRWGRVSLRSGQREFSLNNVCNRVGIVYANILVTVWR